MPKTCWVNKLHILSLLVGSLSYTICIDVLIKRRGVVWYRSKFIVSLVDTVMVCSSISVFHCCLLLLYINVFECTNFQLSLMEMTQADWWTTLPVTKQCPVYSIKWYQSSRKPCRKRQCVPSKCWCLSTVLCVNSLKDHSRNARLLKRLCRCPLYLDINDSSFNYYTLKQFLQCLYALVKDKRKCLIAGYDVSVVSNLRSVCICNLIVFIFLLLLREG
jgi:hypothetical protein